MPQTESYNPLEAFHVLFNYKAAYPVLEFLRKIIGQRAEGVRWSEIFNYVRKEEITKSKGTLNETLNVLTSHELIEKYQDDEGKDRYKITPKGIWCLKKYEIILKGPQLKQIPKLIQDLLVLHGWGHLLPAQNKFIKEHFPPKKNLMIFASPSAGKTFMAECCIFKKLKEGKKVIYLTPFKALNRQKYEHFRKIFGHIGYKVERVDGDTLTPLTTLAQTDLVVSTYERALGGVLRNEEWVSNASLAVADEITLLADEQRGVNVDLLLSSLKEKMQIITLSSHIGNKEELISWLDAETFEYPPDELVKEFLAKEVKGRMLFEDKEGTIKISKDRISALGFIFKHMARKQDETALILVGPRAYAQSLARRVVELSKSSNHSNLSDKVLLSSDERTPLIEELADIVRSGVAFHHAGLFHEVRECIEDLLNQRIINTVVSTPTLSHGVDFPIDHVVIFLDSFEFKKKLDDQSIFPGLSKLEYIQYRGRAGRIGKSKRGNVYVVSDRIPTRTIDSIRRNFLAKKIESATPLTLKIKNFINEPIVDWVVLLTAREKTNFSKKELVEKSYKFIQKLLAYQMLDKNQKDLDFWKRQLESSISRLAKFGFLELSKRFVKITDIGSKTAEINLTPVDSRFVLKNLRVLKKKAKKIDITPNLLAVVSGIGLLRDVDGRRIKAFVRAYKLFCRAQKRKLPLSDWQLMLQTKAWVLYNWINESSISEITSNPIFRGVVYDDDIPRLGRYASMEMTKVASLAKNVGFEEVAKLAEKLAIRLKRGVKSDLVCDDSTLDLFRIGTIKRRRARILSDNGYQNLLHIFSKIFNEGEDVFCQSCGLNTEEASQILDGIKKLFKSDPNLRERCECL